MSTELTRGWYGVVILHPLSVDIPSFGTSKHTSSSSNSTLSVISSHAFSEYFCLAIYVMDKYVAMTWEAGLGSI